MSTKRGNDVIHPIPLCIVDDFPGTSLHWLLPVPIEDKGHGAGELADRGAWQSGSVPWKGRRSGSCGIGISMVMNSRRFSGSIEEQGRFGLGQDRGKHCRSFAALNDGGQETSER
jgi:hypothetical protein